MLRQFLVCIALLTSGLLLIAQNENPQGSAIKSGEILKITVYNEPDFSRIVTVKEDGNVRIPLVGDIKAEGLSPSQFSLALQNALLVYINNPQVATERAGPSR